MDELIKQLAALTEDVTTKLEQSRYEDLVRFVSERERLVQQIMGFSLSPKEKEKYRAEIQRILQMDEAIRIKMTALKEEATKELRKVEAGRKNKMTYAPERIPSDGIFFDKRK